MPEAIFDLGQGSIDTLNRWRGIILNNPIRMLSEEYSIHHFVNSDLVKTETFRVGQLNSEM